MRPSLPPALAGLAVLLAAAGALEAAADWGLISPFTVPRPSAVAAAVWRLMENEALLSALLSTLLTTLAAVGISIGIGVPFGYWLYRHASFGVAYRTWLAALFAAPTILLYPLALVFFGRSYLTIIVMGVLTGVVPMILGVRDGLATVPRALVAVGRAFHVSRAQEFWKILLPAGALMIFSGIRLGTIYTLLNVIGIEFLVNFGGLGFLVSNLNDRFDYPGMYAAILFVILICVAMLSALNLVERRLRPA
jgi:ABC-type nitrate/sulfonate/bicarbonate transport system permease component